MKVKYVQLEPGAYPADHEWQAMTPQERGNYHSIIVFLGCSGGKLPNDVERLRLLCNDSEKNFQSFWQKYRHKFQHNNGEIKHKRVTKEIAKARKNISQKRLAGIASGNARRNKKRTAVQTLVPTAVELIKDKAKVNKDLVISKAKASPVLDLELQKESCLLIEKIERAFKPLTRNEQTTFLRVVEHIAKESPDKLYRASEWFADALSWRSDNRKTRVEAVKVFIAKVKKETGFKKKSL